ncbi:gamma-tubulin complex component 3 [Cryptomeria japonica]|uniref:gamma-tubulin complex component 3 n=1 Tax=Cryptomeria japonica TaxID=3369 RepID=UPI0025AD0D35|nr:gamma-tubulin complex component 3 [Cryptomeria japonica]
MGEQVAGLVRDLVLRMVPRENVGDEGVERAYQYAMRIVGSRITPSLATDEAAMSEAIKRQLVHQGRSSDALTFADLYRRFSAQSCIDNKWAVLYLLRAISEDQRKERGGLFTSTISAPASVGGLHSLPDSFRGLQLYNDNNNSNKNPDQYKTLEHHHPGGVLLLSKDPENAKSLAFREYVEVCREECEVTEGALVKDVLYACQGIDGRYVKFDKDLDGFAVVESYRVPRGTRILVRRLCELGWLYKKVKGYISESVECGPIEAIGTVGQAFCAALQEELSDYYKLLAVLEGQVHNPIPVMEEGKSVGNYLSLRRLMVWLAEPTVRMRLMAVLVDDCKNLRGGAMAGAIHMHAQHGDPLVRDFMKRLLRRVCSPLYEMVRSWVLEGELNDIFSEFFVIGQAANLKTEALWRDGYHLHSAMLPLFIPEPLAKRILRTGKSINFLRVCCEDQGWADAAAEAAAAAGTSTRRGGLGYGETEALETLVVEAAKRIDKHLIEIMYGRYKFREHCLAIKRYLLLGQGDFIQYLMDIVGPDLSQPANTISSFKLAGLLESAIRASNAQYDDTDILDRLRVKMMPHNSGDRGWDVFSLEYNVRDPLNTIFTEAVMTRYLKIFNFLWKLKRVEHALSATWQTMKPNCTIARLFATKDGGGKLQLVAVLRRCQTLRNEMNHFVTNLQYYIMFEVLEYSWVDFLDEMEQARDLDELIAAHEKYLDSILEKSLLGERSHQLCKTLFALFDLILRFRSHADRLYEGAREMQARGEMLSRNKSKKEPQRLGSWVGGGRKSSLQLTGEFLRTMGEEMDAIAVEHSSLLEGFVAQLPLQQHVDLKFLSFRLDFTEFYSQQHPTMHTSPIKLRRTSLRAGKQSQND